MTKANRWAWIISSVAATGAGLVLAFLLSIATNNPRFYERHYVWLYWVNVVVAALLVLAVFTAVSMTLVTTGFGAVLGAGGTRGAVAAAAPGLGLASLAFGVWYAAAAWSLAPYPF